MVAREPTSAGRWSQGATTVLEPHDVKGGRLSREAELGNHHMFGATWRHGCLPRQGGEAREPLRTRSHVAAWEPASAGRRKLGSHHSSEPRDSMGVRLNMVAESEGHHGPTTTWWHGSPPQLGGGARMPQRVPSHVAASEPSSRRHSPLRPRSHVVALEPASAWMRRQGGAMGPEPRGGTKAHLNGEVERGSHHGHGSPSQRRSGTLKSTCGG
jgi:hypothetical protein